MNLCVLFDPETGVIREVKAALGTRSESSILYSLLADIDDIETFIVEPGYLSRINLRLVADLPAPLTLNPRRTTSSKPGDIGHGREG